VRVSSSDSAGPVDGPDVSEEYSSEARGVCPRCGSGNVIHLLIGLLAAPAFPGQVPDWVRPVGCIHPGYTRVCSDCGNTWTPDYQDD
jgi:hypothetical protein